MAGRNFSVEESVTTRLKRTGHIIEVEDPDLSVTFHPTDMDKTSASIISKCNELYPGYQLTEIQLRDVNVQLTEIYKDYDDERSKCKITEAEHLVNLTMSHIKQQFKDQTGAFYVVVEKDGKIEMLKTASDEFDRYLSRLYYESETKNKVITRNTINNSKRLLESFSKETRTLHNRIAKIDNTIYYDLNNEERQCVKITKAGWEIIECPMIFSRADLSRKQQQPKLLFEEPEPESQSRRWVGELIDKFYVKHDYQRTIAEVYLIALFIPDIAHPMFLPTGPPGSGKTLLLKSMRQIVDPRSPDESLVERLPRDEKDRRLSIYNSYFPCFDNESHLDRDLMDELCMWVTGYSGSFRELYTTDEMRTFAAKRAIAITGINIPVTNADAINRAFIADMETIPNGSDAKSESKLISENEFTDRIKKSIPDILAHIFDVLVIALNVYEEVKAQIKPNHRLADFVICGEAISRAIGNKENVFLKAWRQNIQQQNVSVIQNNSFAGLLVDLIFNYYYNETDFQIEPTQLYNDLIKHARERNIEISHNRLYPQTPEWMSRKIKEVKEDLKAAGIFIDPDVRQLQKRWIHIKKMSTKKESIDEYAS
jgi:energy-coupling factor transporter ATP-binding protein EcfA2